MILKALIKKQFYEVFSSFSRGFNSPGKAKKKAVRNLGMTFVLIGVIFGFLGFSIYMLFDTMYPVMVGTPMEWLFFGIAALISILMGTMGSVFSTYSSLYLPKDNEMLMALPIRPSMIILSRMIGVYAMSLIYTALLWVPAMICYYVHAGSLTLVTVLCPILMLLILSLFVQVLTCFFGWLVAMAASRIKGKSILTVLISLFFLGIYYYFYFQLMENLENVLSQLVNIGTIIKSRMYPIYMASMAAGGDTMSLLILGGCVVGLFILCVMLISVNYTRILSMAAFTRKVKYTEKKARSSSVDAALLKREFKHFVSSSTWMLNGAMGLLMFLILAVFAFIKASDVMSYVQMFLSQIPELSKVIPILLSSIACLMLSLNTISAAAVSLEGKTLWILQSIPAAPLKVLQAKERMHVILCMGAAIPSILLLGLTLKLDLLIIAIVLVVSFLFVLFEADLGIMMELIRPNLKWNTEAEVVKRGLAVFVTSFGGMLLSIGIGAGSLYLFIHFPEISTWAVLAPEMVLLAAAVVLIKLWIRKKGVEILMNL